MRAGRLDSPDPREQLLEGDLHLEPREVGAHAEVQAAGAEGDLRVRVAADVEAVASGKTSSSRLPDMNQVTTLSSGA